MMIEHTIFAWSTTILSDQNACLYKGIGGSKVKFEILIDSVNSAFKLSNAFLECRDLFSW